MKTAVILSVAGIVFGAGSVAAARSIPGCVQDHTPGGAVVDGVLGPNEYGPGNTYQFLGGGTGFGGTLGNGALYMESDSSRIYFGFQPGNNLNDLVTILLDTRPGGFTDAQMDDNGDGGRRASSNLSINADDQFGPGFLPDFSVVIGSFGIVSFELTGAPAPLNFLDFSGMFTGNAPTFREYSLPLSALGISPGGEVDFFAAYIADSGYGSNESLPPGPINLFDNPGFGSVSAGYVNFDCFETIPAPGAAGLLGLAALAGLRRRR
jgi:hypothetical protein